MCGIVLVAGNPQDRRFLPSMLAPLLRRGPDDERVVEGSCYAVGVRRLAIVATEFGRQPVSDGSQQVTLAFNGEIYNYESLAADLYRINGVTPRSEAEALLALYLLKGVDFIHSLDGDYAVVVCDDRSRECHLFRDPFGVKPLYYASIAQGRAWAAASEVAAFFRHPDFSTGWDEVALCERRVLGFSACDRTNFAAIRQVPPGARVTVRAFTSPSVVVHPSEGVDACRIAHLSAQSITRECSALLRRAVERRITHSEYFPVVVALSGGIDSTIIAGLSAGCSPEQIVALTISGNVDAAISHRIAASFSLPHHLEPVESGFLLAHYIPIVLASGAQGPSYAAYCLGHCIRRRCARTKVALCGEGADELFLGYWMHVRPQAYVDRAVDALANVPPNAIEASPLLGVVAEWQGSGGEAIQQQLNELFRTHQLVNRHLVPFDHGLMAHGIECRVPFLDREVARFIETVPERARTFENTRKIILRLVAFDLLHPFDAELSRLVLERPTSSLPATMEAPREVLNREIAKCLCACDLRRSRLARFATSPEELFWLGAVDTIFLRHGADVEHMDLPGITKEILDAVAA